MLIVQFNAMLQLNCFMLSKMFSLILMFFIFNTIIYVSKATSCAIQTWFPPERTKSILFYSCSNHLMAIKCHCYVKLCSKKHCYLKYIANFFHCFHGSQQLCNSSHLSQCGSPLLCRLLHHYAFHLLASTTKYCTNLNYAICMNYCA